jgi:hypothetical protein
MKEIDDELLLDIETAVAGGAESNSQIAKAIGWRTSTFKNYRYGKGKNPRYAAFRAPMETAIKKGLRRRRKKLLSASEDALLELLRHDTFEERTSERKLIPKRRRDPESGQYVEVIEEHNVQKITVKRRIPNPVAAMFVAVNASKADGEQVPWQSINKVIEKGRADKGAILGKIDELLS